MTKLAEQLKQGADQAWEPLSEGWRELSARASGALTRFRPAPEANTAPLRHEDSARRGRQSSAGRQASPLDHARH